MKLTAQRHLMGRSGTDDVYLIVDYSEGREEVYESCDDFPALIRVKARMSVVLIRRWHRIVGYLAAGYAVAKAVR